MAKLHSWPTDPAGKAASHSISWAEHQIHLIQAQRAKNPPAAPPAIPGGGLAVADSIKGVIRPQPSIKGVDRGPGGGTAPTAPAGAPAPDPVLDGLIAGAAQRRDDSLTAARTERPQLLAGYGYTASGYDQQTGAPTGLSFDEHNPYSRAALLLRSYNQTRAGTTNGMAARGQLYSGALRRMQRSNEFGYQQRNDALIKALTSGLVSLAGRERAANTTYETDVAGYRAQRAPTA